MEQKIFCVFWNDTTTIFYLKTANCINNCFNSTKRTILNSVKEDTTPYLACRFQSLSVMKCGWSIISTDNCIIYIPDVSQNTALSYSKISLRVKEQYPQHPQGFFFYLQRSGRGDQLVSLICEFTAFTKLFMPRYCISRQGGQVYCFE